MADQIQDRRGTAAAWTTANPVLAAGEPGYETDTRKTKHGDGTTAWASLPYDYTAPGGEGGSTVTIDADGTVVVDGTTVELATDADLTTALAGKAAALTPTAVKNSAYTAAANDLVPVDTTGGAVTITLPPAPADKTRVAIKLVTQGAANAVTVTCGGSDVLNKTGGATSATLTLLNQAITLQYSTTGAIWYVVASDLPYSGLGAQFGPVVGSDAWLKLHARGDLEALVNGAITLDSNGAATAATLLWPDGTAGAYVADTVSTAFPGYVDAWHVTYLGATTRTVSQPSVTRDTTTGKITNQPVMTVS